MSKLRDKFRRKPSRKREDVTAMLAPLADLAEGERVYVQAIPAAVRDEYEISRTREVSGPRGTTRRVVDLTNARAKLAVKALVDESGERVFADEDAAWIGEEYPADVIGQLYDIALRLAGMDDTGEDSKKPDGVKPDDSPTV